AETHRAIIHPIEGGVFYQREQVTRMHEGRTSAGRSRLNLVIVTHHRDVANGPIDPRATCARDDTDAEEDH
ncbi:MAG: hypothetical protein ABIZ56_01035, partial [Chthoniobacteraceae bacterium]